MFATKHALRLPSILLLLVYSSLAVIQVSPPSQPPNGTVVYPNFLGLSLELAFINDYLGNTTDVLPTFLNYLTALHSRTPGTALRLRIGGNSMDSATYVTNQTEAIVYTNPNANINDETVNFGPMLFDLMNAVSESVGGAQYLIGLSLRDPNSTNIPLLAGAARQALGGNLDAFVLGNEPDLYTSHGDRPGLTNYTVADYIQEYGTVLNGLQYTPQGDILSTDAFAGPTICCDWDLASVLQSGWLSAYSDRLKYITVQHYPQNNCFGSYEYGLDYYLNHTDTVELAQWQATGVALANSNHKPILMNEFNSASCGGINNISDSFGAALWTADYALQLASVGYAGAYLHTREHGVSYNPIDPPDPAHAGDAWLTNPNFYAMLVVSETLNAAGANGSRVVDLDAPNAAFAAYAVYDVPTASVCSIMLINYANDTQAVALPQSFFSSGGENITLRYLVSPSVTEKTAISWGNETYDGVTDGVMINASSPWADGSQACVNGCTIQVHGPGLTVVFIGIANNDTAASSNGTSSGDASRANAGNRPLPTDTVRSFICFITVMFCAMTLV